MNASTYEAWKDAPQAMADSSMRGKRMGHKIALVQQQLVLRIENRESEKRRRKRINERIKKYNYVISRRRRDHHHHHHQYALALAR